VRGPKHIVKEGKTLLYIRATWMGWMASRVRLRCSRQREKVEMATKQGLRVFAFRMLAYIDAPSAAKHSTANESK